ncbi:MAG TPA: endonuclease III [Methanocorpusculum sp.]|nr:endonuclease III [Methanocorpusculum sp.]
MTAAESAHPRKKAGKTGSSEAEEILEILNRTYPHTRDDMNFLKFRNPFELLIMTILSAQTTDRTVNGLRDELFDAYPTAERLAEANQEDVERIIRPAGYYHSKAKNIIAASKKLVEEFNGAVPETIEELTTLPGVGRKTANIVTNHAFHKTFGIAVDTHVKRLSIRLGFTAETDPEKIEQDLTRLFDKSWWEHVNYLLISHGRAVCDAKKPDCGHCIIRKYCTYHD